MSTIDPVPSTAQNPSTSSKSDVKSKETAAFDFSNFLKANIAGSSAKEVSEEELFAGSLAQCIKTLKGDDAVKSYQGELEKQKAALKKGDGFIPYEDAAKNALSALVAAGTLTAEEGDKLYAQSFAASQLDSNTAALFDSRGGAGDPTKAVDDLEKALLGARTKIEAFESGKEKFEARKLSEPTLSKAQIMSGGALSSTVGLKGTGTVSAGSFTPTGTKFSGANGFLFKPLAGDGRLAILSPNLVGPLVDAIKLKDKDGNTIEEGRFTSFGDDGKSRAKFSFSKAGSAYGKDVTVEIAYKDGTIQTYAIPDPSKRYE